MRLKKRQLWMLVNWPRKTNPINKGEKFHLAVKRNNNCGLISQEFGFLLVFTSIPAAAAAGLNQLQKLMIL